MLPKTRIMSRKLLLLALCLSSASLACEVTAVGVDGRGAGVEPALLGPCAPIGGFSPEQRTLDRAGRTIFVSVFLPVQRAGADPTRLCGPGPRPVVLIAPASQQDPRQYTSYAEHLASHGLAALLVGYANDPFTADHREAALDLRWLLDWAADQSAQLGGPFGQRFDVDKTAVVGHGSGAAVGIWATLDEPRVVAAAALDPVDGAPFGATPGPAFPSLVPEQLGRLQRPLLLLGELTSAGCTVEGCQACVPAAENYQRFFGSTGGAAVEVTFNAADHNDWLDDPACGFLCDACGGGSALDGDVRRLSRKYLAAFLVSVLSGRADYATALCTSDQPELPPDAIRVSCRDNGKLPALGADGGVGDGGLDGKLGDGGVGDVAVDQAGD
jgi:hypothetical protein